MDIVHRNGNCGPDVLACAQGGCRACLDAVIRQNEGLIHAVLRRTQRGEAPYEELVQEGRIALLLVEGFVEAFQWQTIRPLLPLPLIVPTGVPPERPRRYRSHYVWIPPDDIQSAQDFKGLDDFDLILRLFDFSAWRPILAQRFRNTLGPPPFDPVSLGLGMLLALWRRWSWPELVTELYSPERGPGYCRRLGFRLDDLPCPSTFRMALNHSEPSWILQCVDSVAAGLMHCEIIPTTSTFEPADQGVSVAIDSQLVLSRSHMRCRFQNAACFKPVTERTCLAKAEGRTGCNCDGDDCAQHCRLAAARDPEATYVFYEGKNQPTTTKADEKEGKPRRRGKHYFGYKDKAFNIVDCEASRSAAERTIGCSPSGPCPVPSSPPTATITCRPSLACVICADASPP